LQTENDLLAVRCALSDVRAQRASRVPNLLSLWRLTTSQHAPTTSD